MALPPDMVVVTGAYYSILGSVELSAGWRDTTAKFCPHRKAKRAQKAVSSGRNAWSNEASEREVRASA